jgi:hypothetical protein
VTSARESRKWLEFEMVICTHGDERVKGGEGKRGRRERKPQRSVGWGRGGTQIALRDRECWGEEEEGECLAEGALSLRAGGEGEARYGEVDAEGEGGVDP